MRAVQAAVVRTAAAAHLVGEGGILLLLPSLLLSLCDVPDAGEGARLVDGRGGGRQWLVVELAMDGF